MIELKTGNIFDEKVEALVNPVNCVGVMGKGLALEFKKRFPDNFHIYKDASNREDLQIGKMLIVNVSHDDVKYIINFPTKYHWRNKSCASYIERGLVNLVSEIQRLNIKSIAIPALGCGCGGLQWNEVKYLIKQATQQLDDVNVVLFEP